MVPGPSNLHRSAVYDHICCSGKYQVNIVIVRALLNQHCFRLHRQDFGPVCHFAYCIGILVKKLGRTQFFDQLTSARRVQESISKCHQWIINAEWLARAILVLLSTPMVPKRDYVDEALWPPLLRSGGAFRALALMRVEVAFAEADVFGRDFDEFVIADVGQRAFQ